MTLTTGSGAVTSAWPHQLPPGTPTDAFIDGAFVPAASGETLDSLCPANGRLLTPVAACGPEDVDRAVRGARAAFESGVWRDMAPAERKRILLRFADLVEADAAQIALLDALDAGKPITDCETLDLPDIVRTLRWYAEGIDKLFGHIAPTGQQNLGLIVRQPVGVVAAVLPWNFPAAVLPQKLGPALAAGNSVIVKPPELAPLSALRMASLAAAAGIPEGVLSVLPGWGEVTGQALGLHPDVDVVTFTGSTEVGRAFLRYSADSNLKKVVLECGGKSPQVVMADAGDLRAVAAHLAQAAFWNMGENCTCGSVILADESIRADLLDALIDETRDWKVGDPLDRSARLGPLIEADHLAKVVGYIEDGLRDGASLAYGGRQVLTETGGWYVEPTIFDGVDPAQPLAREEIFGPVACLLGFATEEEAVRLANQSDYGLAASVFSRDMGTAHRIARAIKAGTVSVNCYSEGDITTPFGGFKASGFGGRDKGVEALDQYCEIKTIWYELG